LDYISTLDWSKKFFSAELKLRGLLSSLVLTTFAALQDLAPNFSKMKISTTVLTPYTLSLFIVPVSFTLLVL
jgi:hypothetical protein